MDIYHPYDNITDVCSNVCTFKKQRDVNYKLATGLLVAIIFKCSDDCGVFNIPIWQHGFNLPADRTLTIHGHDTGHPLVTQFSTHTHKVKSTQALQQNIITLNSVLLPFIMSLYCLKAIFYPI